jgi:hypothetical protein
VGEDAGERADDCKGTEPPRTKAGEANEAMKGGVFNGGTDKWLTFDLSGLPKAGPLEGRVRPHCVWRCYSWRRSLAGVAEIGFFPAAADGR